MMQDEQNKDDTKNSAWDEDSKTSDDQPTDDASDEALERREESETPESSSHAASSGRWVSWAALFCAVIAIALILSSHVWQPVWMMRIGTVFAFLGDRHAEEAQLDTEEVFLTFAELQARLDTLHDQMLQQKEAQNTRANRQTAMIGTLRRDIETIQEAVQGLREATDNTAIEAMIDARFTGLDAVVDARFEALRNTALQANTPSDGQALIGLQDQLLQLQGGLDAVQNAQAVLQEHYANSQQAGRSEQVGGISERFMKISNGMLLLQSAIAQGRLPASLLLWVEDLRLDPAQTARLRFLMGEEDHLVVPSQEALMAELEILAPRFRNQTSASTGNDIWSSIEARITNIIQLRRSDAPVFYDPVEDIKMAMRRGDLA
ncbi:MAG: hypothetical protein AAF352_03135, partial [Pseudomonadota bacterium]